jgi:anti-sigma factor RsiW
MIRFTRWRRRSGGMSCEEAAAVLQHYLDAELDQPVARRVTVHLSGCRHCEFELEVYQGIKATIGRRAQDPLEPSVLAALHRFCDDLIGSMPPPEPRDG